MSHPNRKLQRLKGYDYSQNGLYFVTMCVQNREHHFGKIENGQMVLSPVGKVAEICLQHIPDHFPDVVLDQYVIMPNHLHGIIAIERNKKIELGIDEINLLLSDAPVGNENFRSLQPSNMRKTDVYGNPWYGAQSQSLSSIVRGFKIGVTKWLRDRQKIDRKYLNITKLWQKSFHDHIIRDDREFESIQTYIINNPMNWEQDCFYN